MSERDDVKMVGRGWIIGEPLLVSGLEQILKPMKERVSFFLPLSSSTFHQIFSLVPS